MERDSVGVEFEMAIMDVLFGSLCDKVICRWLLFIVIVTSEMGHLLDIYKAQQQLLETTGATLSDEGSYPPARARSTLTVALPSYWLQQMGSIGQGRKVWNPSPTRTRADFLRYRIPKGRILLLWNGAKAHHFSQLEEEETEATFRKDYQARG